MKGLSYTDFEAKRLPRVAKTRVFLLLKRCPIYATLIIHLSTKALLCLAKRQCIRLLKK